MSFAKSLRVGICVGLLGFACGALAQETVFITEFLAANNGPVLDQDGDASDWIEIYNACSAPVNLAGWKLTDDAANRAKWTFPATNLAAGDYLLVFASGKNRAVAGQQLHTSFALDNAGEYLALVKPDGVAIAQQFALVWLNRADLRSADAVTNRAALDILWKKVRLLLRGYEFEDCVVLVGSNLGLEFPYAPYKFFFDKTKNPDPTSGLDVPVIYSMVQQSDGKILIAGDLPTSTGRRRDASNHAESGRSQNW